MKRVIQMGCLIAAVAIAGCASSGSSVKGPSSTELKAMQKVTTQAAFDLHCDQAKLEVMKISDDAKMMGTLNQTWGVRGCDKQATYKSSCGGMMGMCSVFNEAQMNSMGAPTK